MPNEFTDADLASYAAGNAGSTITEAIDHAIGGDPRLARRAAEILIAERVAASGESGTAPRQASEKITRKRRSTLLALLTVAVFGGMGLGYLVSFSPAGIIALGPITNSRDQAALERLPSGESATVGSATLTPLSTYRTDTGEICRTYLIARKNKQSEGVACRKGEGWVVLFAASGIPEQDYRPASGAELSDRYLQSLGASEALSPDAERSALTQTRN